MFACCVQPTILPDDYGTEVFTADPKAGHKGKGKGKKGKGKGRGGGGTKWQIELGGKFTDYGDQEDQILKRAYMIGQKNCKFHLRGQTYEYNFKKMIQNNKDTGKHRKIRPPYIGPQPPAKPLLPQGPMIIVVVKAGQAGTMIDVPNPNCPGQMIQVFVPAHAKPGAKMAIPIPAEGESVETVQKKQQKHDKDTGTKTSSWSSGAKMAAGGAAVAGIAAVGVGGVILGDHLAGGDMADSIGSAAVDAGETIGDGASTAADAVGDWAPGAAEDAGDWISGAADDAGDWTADAAGDVGDWGEDAVGAAGDWLGGAGEDLGGFVMDLF